MATIITFANQKGGVCKTTSTHAVGVNLAQRGFRVLLVDTDPQANLTKTFAASCAFNLGHVIQGQRSLRESCFAVGEGLALVASARELTRLDKVLGQDPNYQFFLREQLAEVAADFDYVLIDTAPGLSSLTYSALVATQFVFVPTEPEFYALEGLGELLTTCAAMQKNFNPGLRVGGVFLVKYAENYRLALHHDMIADAKEKSPEVARLLMVQTIRRNGKVSEAQTLQTTLADYAPGSNGAIDYNNLTSEILERTAA